MSSTHTPHSTRTAGAAPTRRAAVVTSLVAIVVGLPECVLAAYAWVATASSRSEDPLVAIGYVFAVFFGIPGVLGVLLGGLGWRFADHTAGLVLGILGIIVSGSVLLVMLSFWLPQL
jgi:hypothetical protein